MLSFARRKNEVVNLHTSDGLISIKVAIIKGGQVKLAIAAPDSVNIARAEIDDLASVGAETPGQDRRKPLSDVSRFASR